ncbi:MAG: hypothetical protein FGM61_02080 [Sediminibacterium sp.]|nr:hypothetical protein [Sediminibacterium sp.]
MKLLPLFSAAILSFAIAGVQAQPIPNKVQQSLDRFRSQPVAISASPDFVNDLSSIEWHRLAKCWNYTGDPQYFRQLQKIIDPYVAANGTLAGCYPSNNFVNGEALLIVYQVTQQEKYFKAASQLFQLLRSNYFSAKPGTDYAEQLPIAQIPFYAAYAAFMRDTAAYTSLASLLENAFRFLNTSDKVDAVNTTALFSIVVDVYEYYPGAPAAKRIQSLLNRIAAKAATIQWKTNFKHPDPEYQAALQKAQLMYVYAMSKAIRKQYIPSTFSSKLAAVDATIFTRESVAPDWQAVATIESELLQKSATGKNRLFLIDDYFNAEKKIDLSGVEKSYHYKWDEWHNGGFYMLGDIIESAGLQTSTLSAAPTFDNLQDASIYMIVDPDHLADNPNPNYITEAHVQTIVKWVQSGGVLVLFHNDKVNTEFTHFNMLTKSFGIQLNEDIQNKVPGVEFEYGAVKVAPNHPILPNVQKIYQKDICSITIQDPAKALLQKDSLTIFAVAKVGKGTVFVTGDPWLYNEYVDGRKLPSNYENYQAAEELIQWLLKNARK